MLPDTCSGNMFRKKNRKMFPGKVSGNIFPNRLPENASGNVFQNMFPETFSGKCFWKQAFPGFFFQKCFYVLFVMFSSCANSTVFFFSDFQCPSFQFSSFFAFPVFN